MNNSLGFFAKPYSYRYAQWSRIFGFGLFGYDIMFEDSVILRASSETEAENIVKALNDAYNLGRSFEIIRQSISKEN